MKLAVLVPLIGLHFFSFSAHADKYRTLYSCAFSQNITYEISLNNDIALNLWTLGAPIVGLPKQKVVAIQSAGLTTTFKREGQKYIDSGLTGVLSFDSSAKLRPLIGLLIETGMDAATQGTIRLEVSEGRIDGYHIQKIATAIAQSKVVSSSPIDELQKDKDWKVTEMKCSKI